MNKNDKARCRIELAYKKGVQLHLQQMFTATNRNAIVLQHTTVTNNDDNGIRVGDPNVMVVLQNSIIAANKAAACDLASPTMLLKGDRNLISDSSCPFVAPAANLLNTGPLLGPLQLNHGDTPRHPYCPAA